jgi:hypothetical protein
LQLAKPREQIMPVFLPNSDDGMIVWYFWLLHVVLGDVLPNGMALQLPVLATLSQL